MPQALEQLLLDFFGLPPNLCNNDDENIIEQSRQAYLNKERQKEVTRIMLKTVIEDMDDEDAEAVTNNLNLGSKQADQVGKSKTRKD